MTIFSLIPFAAGGFSVAIAVASLYRRTPSFATWCFFVGMLLLAADSTLTGLGIRAANPVDAATSLNLAFMVKSVVPVVWLLFSLTYSRGDYRDSVRRWAIPLVLVGTVPTAIALASSGRLLTVDDSSNVLLQTGPAARALNAILLVSLALVLANVEQTFRAAVGSSRWHIKFVVLAVAVMFGASVYVRSQGILYVRVDSFQLAIESLGLLIACVFLSIGYARTGLSEIDIYPSLAVLRSSITILLVGGYLVIVGVLAQFVRQFGGAERFPLQAFVVLVGISTLAVLLLSDRARRWLHMFGIRHFAKAQHDSVRIWTMFSQRFAHINDSTDLSVAAAKLLSETFDVLSVNVWLVDANTGALALAASTAPQPPSTAGSNGPPTLPAIAEALSGTSTVFNLDALDATWAIELRSLNPTTFTKGGSRMCIPLRTGERALGAVVLADRVGGAAYSVEEHDLLGCVGTQISSVLVNLQLAGEVANTRESDAFRTMSAFFVHDLKNAAASLGLMLKNLPVHFDDPEFRADALRGIGNTTRRIEEMIGRLSAFREELRPNPVATDLNELIGDVLKATGDSPGMQIKTELQPLPRIRVDREQLRSVIANLLLNARDASVNGALIHVRTERHDGRVTLSVADSGQGMSHEFLQQRLFRPFQSTKKNGLGIGLFQCRAIIQAHGGQIHAESELGRGTTFTITLPIGDLQ